MVHDSGSQSLISITNYWWRVILSALLSGHGVELLELKVNEIQAAGAYKNT
jgi:hypothetical protein